MALVSYTNIEDGQVAGANDINQRFGDVLAQINGNLDATNIKNGSLTRQLFATDALSAMWPVGSVYVSVNNTNPSSQLGGTWVQFAAGRTLVGVDTTQDEFNNVEKTGGNKTVALTANQNGPHTHTGTTSTDGNHAHSYSVPYRSQLTHYGSYARVAWEGSYEIGRTTGAAGSHNHRFTTANSGSGEPHSNLQPYIAVYFWKRIS